MTLQSLAKRQLRYSLLARGITISRSKHADALRDFMHSVRPMATEHELVRIGSAADGGYLVPDDMAGAGPCFSPGVSTSASFELDCAKRGIRSFLADYSVDCAPVENDSFHFQKKFLGPIDDEIYMRLSTWVAQQAGDSVDLILQMDIEGDEYQVILDTDDNVLRRFRIMVIEFHSLEYLAEIFGYKFIRQTFQKLLRIFDVVHIHPNNCSKFFRYDDCEIPPVMEFTFLRKDRASKRAPAVSFPHPLDHANVADLPNPPLPACWYENP